MIYHTDSSEPAASLEIWRAGPKNWCGRIGRTVAVGFPSATEAKAAAVKSAVAFKKVVRLDGPPFNIDAPLYDLFIECDLRIRLANSLKAEGISTVHELVRHSRMDLLKSPNFALRDMDTLAQFLMAFGLSLAGESKAKRSEKKNQQGVA